MIHELLQAWQQQLNNKYETGILRNAVQAEISSSASCAEFVFLSGRRSYCIMVVFGIYFPFRFSVEGFSGLFWSCYLFLMVWEFVFWLLITDCHRGCIWWSLLIGPCEIFQQLSVLQPPFRIFTLYLLVWLFICVLQNTSVLSTINKSSGLFLSLEMHWHCKAFSYSI